MQEPGEERLEIHGWTDYLGWIFSCIPVANEATNEVN
jgi:hypothetical protein